MIVGDDLVGDHRSALDGVPKERPGTGRVAVVTQQDIDDYAVFINGPTQVAFLSLADEEHFVDEPVLADRTSAASDLGRQLWPERLDPVEHGSMRDVDAALGQQFEHLATDSG